MNPTKLSDTVISQRSAKCLFSKWLFSGARSTGSGQMINLNKLLYGNGKNYLLVSATAINDNGQIVATAYGIYDGDVHAVLLTPTFMLPPPAP